MIIYGSSKYGKTDHLPGLFYVMTEFAHIYFVPLIPAQSWCILDNGSDNQGVAIRMSGKSVLVAYLRGVMSVAALVATASCIVLASRFFQPNKQPTLLGQTILLGAGAVGGWVLFFLSYRWTKPTPVRALDLAKQLGIPMEILVEHYLDDPRIELLMSAPKDTPADPITDDNIKQE